MNDNDFMIGMDIGDNSAAIAYYDNRKQIPTLLDLSGGYGKPTLPTHMTYMAEGEEWIFGEYALMEGGETRLSREHPEQLTIFVDHLMAQMQSINPSGELKQLVMAVPDEDKGEYFFKGLQGYKGRVQFLPYSQCVLNHHYHTNKSLPGEKVLILDYGQRAVRGYFYQWQKGALNKRSGFEDASLSVASIDERLEAVFLALYAQNSGKDPEDMTDMELSGFKSFVLASKDQLFIKQNRDLKLYMNFAYPPVKVDINKDRQTSIVAPLSEYLKTALIQQIAGMGVALNEVDTVICVGGGFEMSWAKAVVEGLFPDATVAKYKNTKAIAAMGASVVAVSTVGIGKRVEIEETHHLSFDVGMYLGAGTKQVFQPLIYGEDYYVNKSYDFYFVVTQPTDVPFSIDLLKRDIESEEISVFSVLDIAPTDRPTYATKIKLSVKVAKDNRYIEARVEDLGFGGLYEATGFKEAYKIRI